MINETTISFGGEDDALKKIGLDLNFFFIDLNI